MQQANTHTEADIVGHHRPGVQSRSRPYRTKMSSDETVPAARMLMDTDHATQIEVDPDLLICIEMPHNNC